ncbi:MAG: WYL domain-containing protein [Chloroflexota bacterium]
MNNRLSSRTERLAEIEKMLFRSAHGMRAVEIAETCGVDRRTIYRDLDMLSMLGVPIWQDEGRFGIIRDQYLATVRLNFNEAIALFIGARLLSRHADQLNPHLVSSLTKLSMAFPEPLASHVAFTAQAISHYPINNDFVATLEAVTQAWAERRRVRVWYTAHSSGETKAREFSPYFVEPTPQGGLYAIGHDALSGEIRTLKFQRMQKIQLLDERFEIPNDFDINQYFSTAWGIMGGGGEVKVVLNFAHDAVDLIREHNWHESQKIENLSEGGCRMTLWVKDWREMRPWIRSWGSQVEVEEPEALRQDIASDANRVMQKYHEAQKS